MVLRVVDKISANQTFELSTADREEARWGPRWLQAVVSKGIFLALETTRPVRASCTGTNSTQPPPDSRHALRKASALHDTYHLFLPGIATKQSSDDRLSW